MKNIIFLGAGASKADGALLQNELIPKFYELYRTGALQKDGKYCNEVLKYFYRVFGIDADNSPLEDSNIPTFEEAMGMIDISTIKDEDFNRQNANKFHNHFEDDINNQIRRSLIFVIAKTIDNELKKKSNLNSNANFKLVHNLRKRSQIINCFVTTNYDLIIDNAIIGNKIIPYYGFEYLHDISSNSRRIDLLNQYGFEYLHDISSNSRRVDLLKLHGSFNWLRCPVCNNIDVTINEKTIMRLFNDKLLLKNGNVLTKATCPECRSMRKPVIIPPTLFKDYSNVFMQTIWHMAEKEIQTANNIVFCGYSFPDADMHIKYLLKKSELLSKKRLKIYIVNNHPGKSLNMISAEKSRYLRFFSNKDSINYTDYSFQQFADDPYMVLDI